MGLQRIDRLFAQLRADGAKGLMPFICAGDPDIESLGPLLNAAAESGALAVEIGFPFSDPIADGPTIAGAMHRAVERGVGAEQVFAGVKAARAAEGLDDLGIIAMASVSIIHRIGADRFFGLAAESGFDGVILPDAPLEEARQFLDHCESNRLSASLLIAPSTPLDRAAQIADHCRGFVYVLARAGITGAQAAQGQPGTDLVQRIKDLRAVTHLPLACGFGIATPEDVRAVVHDADADAAIVGSALVKRIAEAQPGEAPQAAARYIRELAKGL